jgi:zinc transporter, ZIP family
VIGAFGWGVLASSSLLIGAALALRWTIPPKVLGLVMAFGVGVLISAVAYELVHEAFAVSDGERGVAGGLAAGALAFYVGDRLISRSEGEERPSGNRSKGASARPIILGIVLDGIPESIVIGVGLLVGEGVSVAMLAAVFLSNLPESLAATSGLRATGWTTPRILGLWTGVVTVAGIAAMVGYGLFDSVSRRGLAFTLAFAGGAVLTMLANTMMPEASEYGGREAGLVTTLGFGLAFFLTTLD